MEWACVERRRTVCDDYASGCQLRRRHAEGAERAGGARSEDTLAGRDNPAIIHARLDEADERKDSESVFAGTRKGAHTRLDGWEVPYA